MLASTQLTSLERGCLIISRLRRERDERQERERLEKEAREIHLREERSTKESQRQKGTMLGKMEEPELVRNMTTSATADRAIRQTEGFFKVDGSIDSFAYRAADTNVLSGTDQERVRQGPSRLTSLFQQPRRSLDQSDSYTRSSTSPDVDSEESDDSLHLWRKYCETKASPEGLSEPLFRPKTRSQRELEARKIMYGEKVYIPKANTGIANRLRHEITSRDSEPDANKPLRRVFGAQGGELAFPRTEALGLEDEGEDEATGLELEKEKLSAEEVWKRELKRMFTQAEGVSGSLNYEDIAKCIE
jgi:hypothetical protein